jgi:hypothetical protein
MTIGTTPNVREGILRRIKMRIKRYGKGTMEVHSEVLEALIHESNIAYLLIKEIGKHKADYRSKFPRFEPSERDLKLWKLVEHDLFDQPTP